MADNQNRTLLNLRERDIVARVLGDGWITPLASEAVVDPVDLFCGFLGCGFTFNNNESASVGVRVIEVVSGIPTLQSQNGYCQER